MPVVAGIRIVMKGSSMIDFPSRQRGVRQFCARNVFTRFTFLSRASVPILAAFLALVPAIRTAQAQLLFGSIVGNVVDSSGAAVPGATVRVTQLETNESRETKTNESGGYLLSTVPVPEGTDIEVHIPAIR